MKRKLIYITLVVVIFFATGITYVTYNVQSKTEEINKKEELPELSSIDSQKSPMLWDFINGSMTYKTDIDDIEQYGAYYLILKEDDEDYIYISNYDHGAYIIAPDLGSDPEKVKLNEEQLKLFDEYTSKMSKSRVFKEGEYNFYFISNLPNEFDENQYDRVDEFNIWAGIDFTPYYGENAMNNPGNMNKEIYEKGLGYPTEWLRKEPYRTTMKEYEYINVDSEFWDDYNWKQRIIIKKGDETKEVKVEFTNMFEVPFGDETDTLTKEQFEQYVEFEGWEQVR